MTLLPCPTCGARFDVARSEALPFCSQRCRMIDLGRWLNEEYGLPTEPERDALDLPADDHLPPSS